MKRSHANGRLVFKRSDEHRRTQEPLDFVCDRVGLFGIEFVEKRHEHRSRRTEQTTLAARTIHEAGGALRQNAVACIKAKAGIDLSDIVDFNGDQARLARDATHFANGVDQGVDVARAGHGIGRICQAAVDNHAHVHVGLGIGAVQAVARAVAKHVCFGGIHHAILHVVEVPRAVYHHVELGAYVAAVLGVDASKPHIDRVKRVLGGQVKIAHGVNRPLRFARIEVKDERIARLRAHGDRLEHPVVAGKPIDDWVLWHVIVFRLLHTMHKLIAIHFAIGIHRHLATRIACKRVDVRATKTKTGDHGRLAT